MKRICFLFTLLLMPVLVSAKTITCTSVDDFTVGKNVYDGISVTCSEGETQIFAVQETSNELTWNNVVNPYPAVSEKKYEIDFVWTGTFDSGVDTMIVDEEDLTDVAFMCDTGCHLYTKTVTPKPASNTDIGTEKDIAVGTIYYVGDRIKFNDISIILYTDLDDEFLEVDNRSYVLPEPEFYYDDAYNNGAGIYVWSFENFLRQYDDSGLYGLYYGYVTDVSSDRVPIGIKCIGGNGSDTNHPYVFELVYEDSNTNSEPNEPATISYSILEGANQTYTKGSNTNIVIKASGDIDKLMAVEIDNGNVISSSNYELANGSTILTLLASFLEDSSIGEHTITFKYNDGEVSTKLTIVEASNSNNDNSDEEPANNSDENENTTTEPETTNNGTNGNSGNNSNSNTNTTSNPQTGDNIMFYISLLGLSIIGFVGAEIYLKKKKFN